MGGGGGVDVIIEPEFHYVRGLVSFGDNLPPDFTKQIHHLQDVRIKVEHSPHALMGEASTTFKKQHQTGQSSLLAWLNIY